MSVSRLVHVLAEITRHQPTAGRVQESARQAIVIGLGATMADRLLAEGAALAASAAVALGRRMVSRGEGTA